MINHPYLFFFDFLGVHWALPMALCTTTALPFYLSIMRYLLTKFMATSLLDSRCIADLPSVALRTGSLRRTVRLHHGMEHLVLKPNSIESRLNIASLVSRRSLAKAVSGTHRHTAPISRSRTPDRGTHQLHRDELALSMLG